MKRIIALLFLLALRPSIASSTDRYEAARMLRARMSGLVEFSRIEPAWAPDGSALYFQRDAKIFRVGTEDGVRHLVVDPARLTSFFSETEPQIHRFLVDDAGAVVCLAASGDTVRTLRGHPGEIAPVAPESDPFSVSPRIVDKRLKSARGKGRTTLFFINHSTEPVEVEWVDASGGRKKYATLPSGGTHAQGTHAGHVFVAGGRAFHAGQEPGVAHVGLEDAPKAPPRPTAEPRPWKIFVRDHNVFARHRATGEEVRFTTDGTADWPYRGPADWSPNGRHFVVMRKTPGSGRRVHLIEAAPKGQLQPKLTSVPYLKPGDALDLKTPRLFDMETRTAIPLDETRYSNPWSLTRFHWSRQGDRLFFVSNQRGHQRLRLLAIEAETGQVGMVVEERSPTFIDYSQKLYLHQLEETDEALWMSERSGWNHLYLVDRKTGAVQPITSGKYVVRGVEHVDAKKRQIWFRVLGVHADQDPYYVHHARVDFDGSNLTLLTEDNGTHQLQFSPDRRFYIDTWSRVDQPPQHALRRASDGQKVADLGRAVASKLWAVHPHRPEPFCAKGRDGVTDIYGVLYRPSHFDPSKQYPVVEAIYAGPHDHFVPKAFKPYDSAQRMAELGFIVARIDGMGTNWRSKEFHDVCWKNLKDAGFPDRIAWLKAAARKYPYMDLSRVGIYGGSAGGQNALRAVIDHADFYRAAASDCGCHDNRMDKVWWNEAWMGWPVDESYARSSNVVDAHKLDGKLLLTVGMLDKNVDPSSTMQVVGALIQANKDFEFIAFPDKGHGAGESEYGQRRRADFFLRHLVE